MDHMAITGAIACRDSCFGYSSLEQGYTDFDSCNDEETLLACGEIADDGHFPDMNAGVICCKCKIIQYKFSLL